MTYLLGFLRACLTVLTLGLGCMLMIITSFLPIHIGPYRLPFWVLRYTAAFILRGQNVRVACPQPEKLRTLRGFIFANHVSYIDVLALLTVTPTRFLAKSEIRAWPIVGRAAAAIGCVFVQRESKDSRSQARTAVVTAEKFPPITIFPEGKRGPRRRVGRNRGRRD